jgi:hypothetical protein
LYSLAGWWILFGYSGDSRSVIAKFIVGLKDHAINWCPGLEIRLPRDSRELRQLANNMKKQSSHGDMKGAVGALDGGLCRIKTPRLSETLNVKGYFSGHYQTMGVNVQAM